MAETETNVVAAKEIAYWNGAVGERWSRYADDQDRMLTRPTEVVLDASDIAPGQRFLDVGCGAGATTLAAGRRLEGAGEAVGIDVSEPLLAVARQRLAEAGLSGVRFELRDAAAYASPDGGYDRVFSRLGVMFFADPEATFANLRRAVRPGGRLVFLCWQSLDRNPWMQIPFHKALEYLPAPEPPPPGAPGPFSFRNPDRVREILTHGGFGAIAVEGLTTKLLFGPDPRAAANLLAQFGPAARLLANQSDDLRERIVGDVTEIASGYRLDGDVMIDGSFWIVTATAP